MVAGGRGGTAEPDHEGCCDDIELGKDVVYCCAFCSDAFNAIAKAANDVKGYHDVKTTRVVDVEVRWEGVSPGSYRFLHDLI